MKAHGRLIALSMAAGVLAGCAGTGNPGVVRRPARPPCPFATCSEDASALAKLTATQLGQPVAQIEVARIEPQFAGAVLVWRARAGGRVYDCKEGRNAATGAVHYIECRPSSDTAGLKAFP